MSQQASLCSRHRILVVLLFCITTLTSSLRHDKIMPFVSADDTQLQIDRPSDRSADVINSPHGLPVHGTVDTAGFQPTSPADDDGQDEGELSGLTRLKRRRRSVDDSNVGESKRYSSFRSDLGKRSRTMEELATDNDYAETDKRAAAFRSDLGKRRAFRSDLGKRSDNEEERLDETKRYSSFRSDLGKRFSNDDDDHVKRYAAFRSDLGKRISAMENDDQTAAAADFESSRFADNTAADKRAAFRSDLGKRRAFRSDLGKRLVTKKLAFRSDLGKRSVAFRSDLGKRFEP